MIDPIRDGFDNGGKRKDRITNVKGDLELGKKIENVAVSNTDGNKSLKVVPENNNWIQWVLDHKVQVFILLGVAILVLIIATVTGSASSSKSNEMTIAVQETTEIPPSSTSTTSFPTFLPTPTILARVPIMTPIPTTSNPTTAPSEKPTPLPTIPPSEKPTPLPTIPPSKKPTPMPTPSPTKTPSVSPTRRAETNRPTPIPTSSFSLVISPPQTEMPVVPPTEAPTGPCDWFLNP